MYLKRIELYGFKSFAQRTELEFVPGITAVVGPNGSGKSNVSDSIRWVLGEQSAKSLRGAKMEDIIFAGSDTRNPVNYCEVAITLDNEDQSLDIDYSEVTITRRVYRSGESEYMINQEACRLKDIIELLMDTGLGKEAYSIIGQGRVEEILSTKAEDRRGIFEEAAGIVKYKSRKRDAERKLEETESNLLRIQDIIHEIEEQIEPLEEQANQAQRYQQVKKRLTDKEIATYVYQIDILNQKLELATHRLHEIKPRAERLSVKILQDEAQWEEQKQNIDQLEHKMDAYQQQLLDMTESIQKLEGQRDVLRERKRNFSSNKQEMLEKEASLTQRYRAMTEESSGARQQLHELHDQVKRLQHELNEKETDIDQLIQHIAEQLEHKKGDYIELLNARASRNNERQHLQQSMMQHRHKLSRLDKENKEHIEERNKIIALIQLTEEEQAAICSQLKDCNMKDKQLKHEQTVLLEKREQLEEKIRQDRSTFEQLQSKQQFLHELKEDFGGFFQGVKHVLKARDRDLQGIEGAIAELIKVPKHLEVAIETALGNALQHIIVADEQAGQEAIRYLKQRQLGRATFLPLNTIRGRTLSSSDISLLQHEEGCIGIAADLIDYDSLYQTVITSFLGQVIITEHIEHANSLAKLLRHRYRLVTLDGDMINPGGAMSGGSRKQKQSNLLGRDRQIEKLNAEMRRVQEIAQKTQKDVTACKQKEADLAYEREQINEHQQHLQEREQKQKDRLSQLNYAKQRLDEHLDIYDQESAAYRTELRLLQEKEADLQQQIEQENKRIERTESEIKELEREQKEKMISKEKHQEQMTETKVQLASKIKEYEGLKEQARRLEQNKKEIETEWDDIQYNLKQLDGNLDVQDNQVEELEAMIEQKKTQKEYVSEQVERIRKERKSNQQARQSIEMELNHRRNQYKSLQKSIHEEEVQVNRLDVEMENKLTLLREEYELSYELAKERYPLEQEYSLAQQEVEELKLAIEKMGRVNLGAIEEFKRISERYHFLQQQEDDLKQAKQTLYGVIGQMETEMVKRFKQTFTEVRKEFLIVFQQLFGGGQADLFLADPDHLLTSGVDIVAQPPGKKLQHLGLLSGGERSLTAIALLFAILKVKPVPFCVLDEVEAALDDANITRFAQYVRQFSAQTQFIVITHRKGTMEEADVLYGITMQESGVSTLVSVKLVEKEQVS